MVSVISLITTCTVLTVQQCYTGHGGDVNSLCLWDLVKWLLAQGFQLLPPQMASVAHPSPISRSPTLLLTLSHNTLAL